MFEAGGKALKLDFLVSPCAAFRIERNSVAKPAVVLRSISEKVKFDK